MVKFVMCNREGAQYALSYDPQRHRLCNDKQPIRVEGLNSSKSCPERGLVVRLVLGKKCNFKCAYCCQHMSGKRQEPDLGELEQLVEHIFRIAGKKGVAVVQFWGGEPFLYFNALKKLHTLFMAHTNQGATPEFFLATNGSLLNGERLQWVLDNQIAVMLSWDGPGQSLRGIDVLREGKVLEAVREIYAKQPDKISIAPIMSRLTSSHSAVVEMVREKLGTDVFQMGEGRVITVVDAASMSAAITAADLPSLGRHMHADLVTGKLPQFGMAHEMASRWALSVNKDSFSPHICRCHVGSANTLIVDLAGNVLTCATFESTDTDESGEAHKLCHIAEMRTMADRPVPILSRLRTRLENHCCECPVLQACRGGCPYAPDAYETYNCAASYAWNLPIVGLALHILTGDILQEVALSTGEA